MRKHYIKTRYPKMFCPHCSTRLEISNLNKKLWCPECYKYVKEEDLMNKFIRGFESV